MKRRWTVTCAVLLSGLWIGVAAAAEGGAEAGPPVQAEEEQVATPAGTEAPAAAVGEGTVPQAQIDIFKKREAAKQRRDEALRVRAVMTQSDD